MKKNIMKILSISAILLFIFVSSNSYAAIDMNLASNLTANNNSSNNSSSNSSTNTNTSSSNSQSSNVSNSSSEAATVSSVSSVPDSQLGLTNILNIILIAVGVLLILLGIAVLIKLKH